MQNIQKTATIPKVRVQNLVRFDMPVVVQRLAPGTVSAGSSGTVLAVETAAGAGAAGGVCLLPARDGSSSRT